MVEKGTGTVRGWRPNVGKVMRERERQDSYIERKPLMQYISYQGKLGMKHVHSPTWRLQNVYV